MNIFRTSAEKPLRFMGIAFRNRHHITYFLISSAVTLSWLAMLCVKKEYSYAFVPLTISIGQALIAIIVTGFGRRTDGAYSRDCIWWNLLLAGISLLSILLVK